MSPAITRARPFRRSAASALGDLVDEPGDALGGVRDREAPGALAHGGERRAVGEQPATAPRRPAPVSAA